MHFIIICEAKPTKMEAMKGGGLPRAPGVLSVAGEGKERILRRGLDSWTSCL